MLVLTAAFVWYMSPFALGFLQWPRGTRLQIAEGVFRFSYFVLNPAMVLTWAALPLFHNRGHSGFGWRLLGLISFLLACCIAAIFVIV